MRSQQLKFNILLSALALVFSADRISRAQSQRQEVRPVNAHSQKAKDRGSVQNYQRDPIRLVKEFYLNKSTSEVAFDLALTVENALGNSAWDKLDEKQRASVTKAFDGTIKEVLEEWDPETVEQVRVLKSEIKGNRATITVLRELELIRISLAARDGAWFIIEHEVVDDALPEFADAIRDALDPGAGRGRVYDMPSGNALKYVDEMIAKQGESPQLLLLKYRVLVSRQFEEEQTQAGETLRVMKGGKAQSIEAQLKEQLPAQNDRALELLLQITTRWPKFAPGYLALSFDLLYYGNDDAMVNSISKDAERAIAPLRNYIELVPYDPRPWRDLAHAYMLLERNSEAESAFRSAIERDPTYLDHYASLVSFLLLSDQPEKAKVSFGQMLKVAPSPDEAFEGFYDDEGFDPDYAKALENLLLSYAKELGASKSGLVLLANAQEAQNKMADAAKTMQRAVAIKAEPDDYEYLSQLYRQQQRFTEALNATNQALKLDSKFAMAYFERACSLAQLGRKREAMAALKQVMALNPEALFDPDEPDLQPLANLPEFKALREKMSATFTSAEEKKAEEERKEKAKRIRSGKP